MKKKSWFFLGGMGRPGEGGGFCVRCVVGGDKALCYWFALFVFLLGGEEGLGGRGGGGEGFGVVVFSV